MTPEQLFQEASQRALQLDVTKPPEDAELERLRLECAAFFDRISEPPVYRRVDDPARKSAEALLPEGRELLARLIALGRDAGASSRVVPLAEALRWHLTSLCHVADGRLDAAETAWQTAIEREGVASASRRAWARSDELERPVFDRGTGTSRFDPRPEPLLQVKLVCPYDDCQTADRYALAPTYATHRFRCAHCKRGFIGFFGEAQGVELTPLGGDRRRYLFRVQELSSGMSRVEFEDCSGAELIVARRDLLAFLYTQERELKAVLNLSSSRLLWVQRGGYCFIAAAALGERAAELAAFRTFRDEVLARSELGWQLVRAYYRVGPRLAEWVGRSAVLRAGARAIIGALHTGLIRRWTP